MKTILHLFLIALTIFLGCIIGTLFGAFSGWLIGLFFENTIIGILASLGITGFKMWQIGAFLGFVSGFFKSTTVNYN